jgi:hypothetical protein
MVGQVNIATWQANPQHTGANLQETILTPGNVGSPGSFGLLFTQPLDGQSYGQPLYVSAATLGQFADGSTHNVVYVATEHDSIYAFDADSNLLQGSAPLWHTSLLPAGTTPVAPGDVGSGDIQVEIGVTTTPVIDTTGGTLYVISKVKTTDRVFEQFLYALDLKTGAAKFGSPVLINATFAGSSYDAVNGVISFSALHQHSRAAMIFYNGVVYISYASHSDTPPYHGLILGYDATSLQLIKTFITTPNGVEGGIWGAGAGPAVDSQGNMFVSVANGAFDQQASAYTGLTDWGESFLKLPTNTLGPISLSYSSTQNWFTPNIWSSLNGGDFDLGSGGVLLLPDQVGGTHPHILVGGGKGGILYVVDRDNLGGLHNPDGAIQEIPEPNGGYLFVTPAYFNSNIYYATAGGPLEQRAVGFIPATGGYVGVTPITSSKTYSNKGSGVFISANGNTNGVVWTLNGSGLDAYNAANVSGAPIYTAQSTVPAGNISTQNTKFSLPMVANGKVYYTAYNTATNIGYLFVSGLLGTAGGLPLAPSNLQVSGASSGSVVLTWTDNSNNEAGFNILRSTSASGPFAQAGSVGANVTTFTDTGLSPQTTYFYEVYATNASGNSSLSSVATATTFPVFTQTGLVAYWNLDAIGTNNSVPDVTNHGNNGTANGEAVFTQGGFINGAFTFHGTNVVSNISVPNSPSLQFGITQSFTLSAWANPANLDATEQPIIAKSADQGNQYGIYINAGNNWVFRGSNGDLVGPAAVQGAWTHVAGVQDGVAGTRSLYVNGVLVASSVAQAADGAGALVMGQSIATGGSLGYEGLIDEVRLYSIALPPAGIMDLLGPPVLEAVSNQTQGAAGTFGIILSPASGPVDEPREGAVTGAYSVAFHFAAPVSPGIAASLSLQNGGSAVGSVNSVVYDPSQTVVTVNLASVANSQSLNIHLTGINPGNGTADIPLNILWGDVNGDQVVNNLDLTIVQQNFTPAINQSTFIYDINGDGVVNSVDAALISGAIGSTPTLPVISAVSSSGVTPTLATITWTTDQPSSSQVEFGTTTGYGSFSTPNSALVTAHSVTLTGLTPGTTYNYAVISANSAGSATSTNFTFSTPATAVTSTISRVGGASSNTGTNPNPTSLSITYSSSNGNTIVAVCALGVTSSSIGSITDGGSTWALRAFAVNGTAVRSEIWSTTAGASVASTSFAINILGGSPASCALEEYAGVLGLGATATNAATSGTMSVSLTTQDANNFVVAGLGANSYYGFSATSGGIQQTGGLTSNQGNNYVEMDLFDNTAPTATSVTCSSVSGPATWAIPALELRSVSGAVSVPVISAVSFSGITATSATLTWTTDQASSSQVEYGTTASYGSLSMLVSTPVTSHSVTLTGLTAGTTYNYAVLSANSAGTATSSNFTFSTPVPAPVISAVGASGITTTSATITWTTDQPSNSQVEYGTTTGYGSLSPINFSLVTSHSAVLTGLTAGTTYNYAVMSASTGGPATSANFTISTAPTIPVISAVSSSGVTTTSVTITWTTDQLSSSQVEYGTTTGYGTSSTLNSALVTAHSVTLTGLNTGTTYDYAVMSVNSAGAATSTNFTFSTPVTVATSAISRVGGASNNTGTNPSPTSLSVAYQSSNGNTIVAVCALGGTSSSIRSVTDSGSTWALRAFAVNGAAVRSEIWSTSAGASVASSSFTIMISGGTPASCAIEEYAGVLGLGTTATNAATSGTMSVSLTTQDPNNVVVAGLGANSYYGYTATGGTIRQTGGLTSNQGSNYVEMDLFDNTASTASLVTCSSVSGPATWAAPALELRSVSGVASIPVISGVMSSGVTATSAIITWTTDQASSSQVEYGKTAGYGSVSVLNSAYITSHSVTLTGLTPGTAYNYAAMSANSAGPATSANFMFSTPVPAPVISAITSSGVTANSVTIAWTTDQLSSSQVEYGTTTSYGSLSTLNSALVTAHSVTLTGLAPGTTYNYAVMSATSGGATISTNLTFVTSATPPAISAVSSSGVTSTSATVTWTTDQPSSSQVEYGTTTSYGTLSTLNSALVTAHSITLTGLTPGTTYNYAVMSATSAGPTTSTNFTFSTPAAMPVISAVVSSSITSNSAIITWTTDLASSSQVGYGTTPSYGSLSALNSTPVTAHSVTLTGLIPGTAYNYDALSATSAGTSKSANFTFSTLPTIPVISAVTSSGVTSASATISWTTDQPSNSQVAYGTSISYGTLSTLNSALVTAHSITLTGLTPGTAYNYVVTSANAAGPATSTNFTFATPLVSNISRVGGTFGNTGTNGTATSLVLPYTSHNGNTIVAVCALGNTTSSISSITDSGSVWALRAFINNGTAVRSEIWSTTAGGSVASAAIKVNLSAGTPASCGLEEYSGVLSLGGTATAQGNSGTFSVSITTHEANDYAVAGLGANAYSNLLATNGAIRQFGGLTQNSGSNYVEMALCDNTAATPTSVSCSSVSGSARWAAPALELRVAAH